MKESKIVIFQTFDTLGEAELTKALLDSAGIECALVNDVLSSVLPLGSFARVAIEMSGDDVPLAREVLAAGFDKAELADEMKTAKKQPGD